MTTINQTKALGWLTSLGSPSAAGGCTPLQVSSYENKLSNVYFADQDGMVTSSTPDSFTVPATLECGTSSLVYSIATALPYDIPGMVLSQLNVDLGRIESDFPSEFEITGFQTDHTIGNGVYTMTTRFKNNKPTYVNENGWVIFWNGSDWSMVDKLINSETEFKNGDDDPAGGYWQNHHGIQFGQGPNSPTPTPTPTPTPSMFDCTRWIPQEAFDSNKFSMILGINQTNSTQTYHGSYFQNFVKNDQIAHSNLYGNPYEIAVGTWCDVTLTFPNGQAAGNIRFMDWNPTGGQLYFKRMNECYSVVIPPVSHRGIVHASMTLYNTLPEDCLDTRHKIRIKGPTGLADGRLWGNHSGVDKVYIEGGVLELTFHEDYVGFHIFNFDVEKALWFEMLDEKDGRKKYTPTNQTYEDNMFDMGTSSGCNAYKCGSESNIFPYTITGTMDFFLGERQVSGSSGSFFSGKPQVSDPLDHNADNVYEMTLRSHGLNYATDDLNIKIRICKSISGETPTEGVHEYVMGIASGYQPVGGPGTLMSHSQWPHWHGSTMLQRNLPMKIIQWDGDSPVVYSSNYIEQPRHAIVSNSGGYTPGNGITVTIDPLVAPVFTGEALIFTNEFPAPQTEFELTADAEIGDTEIVGNLTKGNLLNDHVGYPRYYRQTGNGIPTSSMKGGLVTLPLADQDTKWELVDSKSDVCVSDPNIQIDLTRGDCAFTLPWDSAYSEVSADGIRSIISNNIPNHSVGLFGPGGINPNTITVQNNLYEITLNPQEATTLTPLQGSHGPMYSFGVFLNGVELDPVAAEPWPHPQGHPPWNGVNVNWDWNLEASMVQIGLDCNNAHVQPTGKYHYHGTPTLYLESLPQYANGTMVLLGYAADGFPIYGKYGHAIAVSSSSVIVELKSSYRLKTGQRPGDGVSAPCGNYTGVYTADWEYVEGLGDLDECNGRVGYTPEYPNGTYYYVITDDYPGIPRYFKGTPSDSFKLDGQNPPSRVDTPNALCVVSTDYPAYEGTYNKVDNFSFRTHPVWQMVKTSSSGTTYCYIFTLGIPRSNGAIPWVGKTSTNDVLFENFQGSEVSMDTYQMDPADNPNTVGPSDRPWGGLTVSADPCITPTPNLIPTPTPTPIALRFDNYPSNSFQQQYISCPENELYVVDVTTTGGVGTITYTLAGGNDKDLFDIDASGRVTWKVAPDYENNLSSGNTQEKYSIAVSATDAEGTNIFVLLMITVTDVEESPTPIHQACNPTDSVCVSGFPNQGALVFNGEYTYNAGPGIDDDNLNTGKPYWENGNMRLYYMTQEMASGQTSTTGNYWYFTWTSAPALVPVHSSLDNEGTNYPWEADWQGNGTVECGSCLTPITDANFFIARDLWFSDESGAIATYGHIRDWDVSAVTNMYRAFHNKESFNEDISGWNVSKVTMMAMTFENAKKFNQDISDWNVSSVTNMNGIFDGAREFNQDIGNWNVENADSMQSMFKDTSFNQNIGGWTTSSALRMSGMFSGNRVFNQDISNWNVSKVKDFGSMFRQAMKFNQPIGKWDVSSAENTNTDNMKSMFYEAYDFNQDLSGWCVYEVSSEPSDFFQNGHPMKSSPEKHPKWGECVDSCPSSVCPI